MIFFPPYMNGKLKLFFYVDAPASLSASEYENLINLINASDLKQKHKDQH